MQIITMTIGGKLQSFEFDVKDRVGAVRSCQHVPAQELIAQQSEPQRRGWKKRIDVPILKKRHI